MAQHQHTDPLQIVALSKVYPNGYQALDRVTLGLARQEVLGLLGPNGAGKSTLFGIISTFISRSKGTTRL